MDAVEKNSFIALPGKGGHSRLIPSKLSVTPPGAVVESLEFKEQTWSTHGHSSNWLVVRSVGLSIINLLLPSGLGSMYLWAAYN